MRAIDDQVWASIPPRTGRLAPRTERLILSVAIALVLVLVAVNALDRGGLFRPQLTTAGTGWNGEYIDAEGNTHSATIGMPRVMLLSAGFGLTNTGAAEVRVRDIWIEAQGIEFVRSRVGITHRGSDGVVRSGGRVLSKAQPHVLAPNETAPLAIEFRLIECETPGTPDVWVSIDSWRGKQTVRLPAPLVRHNSGGWRVTTVDDPEGVNGVQYLAQRACAAGP